MSHAGKLVLGIAAGALAATAVFAASMHAERETAMKAQGAAGGPLFAMASGKAPYDAAAATTAAEAFLAATKWDPVALFPEGDVEGEGNRALPAIWENFDDFTAEHDALVAAAETLAVEAGKGLDQLKAALGPVGESCNSCHETYRKPE
jgi:cytochrome c556